MMATQTQKSKTILAIKPQTMGSGANSPWIGLREGAMARIILLIGQASTNAGTTITLNKATDSTGATHSDGIYFYDYWLCTDVAGAGTAGTTAQVAARDALTKASTTFGTGVNSCTFGSTTTSGNSLCVIELRAEHLTSISGVPYPYFQVAVTAAGAANILACIVEVYDDRYQQDSGPSALT